MGHIIPGVDPRHLRLVVKLMGHFMEMLGYNRYGIQSVITASPITRGLFETPVRILVNAAQRGECDTMDGITENAMMGQIMEMGAMQIMVSTDPDDPMRQEHDRFVTTVNRTTISDHRSGQRDMWLINRPMEPLIRLRRRWTAREHLMSRIHWLTEYLRYRQLGEPLPKSWRTALIKWMSKWNSSDNGGPSNMLHTDVRAEIEQLLSSNQTLHGPLNRIQPMLATEREDTDDDDDEYETAEQWLESLIRSRYVPNTRHIAKLPYLHVSGAKLTVLDAIPPSTGVGLPPLPAVPPTVAASMKHLVGDTHQSFRLGTSSASLILTDDKNSHRPSVSKEDVSSTSRMTELTKIRVLSRIRMWQQPPIQSLYGDTFLIAMNRGDAIPFAYNLVYSNPRGMNKDLESAAQRLNMAFVETQPLPRHGRSGPNGTSVAGTGTSVGLSSATIEQQKTATPRRGCWSFQYSGQQTSSKRTSLDDRPYQDKKTESWSKFWSMSHMILPG